MYKVIDGCTDKVMYESAYLTLVNEYCARLNREYQVTRFYVDRRQLDGQALETRRATDSRSV